MHRLYGLKIQDRVEEESSTRAGRVIYPWINGEDPYPPVD
jgi:hypothetical protein